MSVFTPGNSSNLFLSTGSGIDQSAPIGYTGSQMSSQERFIATAPRYPAQERGTWGSLWDQLGLLSWKPTVPEHEPDVLISLRSWEYLFRFMGLVPSPSGVSRTFGSRSTSGSDVEESLVMRDNRRLYLIDKKCNGDITPSETDELQQLQADAASYLNAVAPLPTEFLDRLEALADKLEQRRTRKGS